MELAIYVVRLRESWFMRSSSHTSRYPSMSSASCNNRAAVAFWLMRMKFRWEGCDVEFPISMNCDFILDASYRMKTRGWKKMSPDTQERTRMLTRCGKKCFLGPKKSFPICARRTCKVDLRGVQSAYNRARQFKYTRVAKKAKALLRQTRRK